MKVVVIGDIILDKYIFGKVNRISPEAPVPIVNVTEEKFILGGAGNVAMNLVKLGVKTHIYGLVGTDHYGRIVKTLLLNNGISSSVRELTNFPTVSKIRIIGEKQQIARIDYEDVQKKLSIEESKIEEIFFDKELKLVILSDYAKNVLTDEITKLIMKLANENNIKVLVDPKGKNWGKYFGSFVVTPNLKELSEVYGRTIPNIDEDVVSIGREIKEKYGIVNLIITRSEKGITLISEDNSYHHFGTFAKEIFDVSGAGDTVIAVLGKCIAENYDLETSITLANLAAGYVISKIGTYAISIDELNSLIKP